MFSPATSIAPHPRLTDWNQDSSILAVFRTERGRWPLGDSADATEASLGRWQETQRDARGNGTLTAERIAALDSSAPGWETPDDDTWYDYADDLSEFRDDNGRWPATHTADGQEGRVARWRNKQRAAADDDRAWLTATKRTYLNLTSPGWDRLIDASFNVNVAGAAAFLAEHGYWPSSRNPETDEGAVAVFIASQRAHDKGAKSSFPAERRAELNRVLPGWDRYRELESVRVNRHVRR